MAQTKKKLSAPKKFFLIFIEILDKRILAGTNKVSHTHIERLSGSEKFHTWCFALRRVLVLGLDGCIQVSSKDENPENEEKALAIDESCACAQVEDR